MKIHSNFLLNILLINYHTNIKMFNETAKYLNKKLCQDVSPMILVFYLT